MATDRRPTERQGFSGAIEYAVGIRWPEGTDTTAYDEIVNLPDHVPEKHELMAHMLLLAVRKEWEMADRMRTFARRQQQREQRRAEIRAGKGEL